MSERDLILLMVVVALLFIGGGLLIGHWWGKCSARPEKGTYIGTICVYKNDMLILEWCLREGDTVMNFSSNPHRMTFEPKN